MYEVRCKRYFGEEGVEEEDGERDEREARELASLEVLGVAHERPGGHRVQQRLVGEKAAEHVEGASAQRRPHARDARPDAPPDALADADAATAVAQHKLHLQGVNISTSVLCINQLVYK